MRKWLREEWKLLFARAYPFSLRGVWRMARPYLWILTLAITIIGVLIETDAIFYRHDFGIALRALLFIWMLVPLWWLLVSRFGLVSILVPISVPVALTFYLVLA